MTITEKLSKIQQEIKVHKGQYNSFGKYNYRSAEDILEALKPMEKKYNVCFMSTEHLEQIGDHVAVLATASITNVDETGTIEAQATAIIDFDSKGMQMPQRTGAASSYAKKYAYGNLLLLDDTKDSDATNDHSKAPKKAVKAEKKVPTPQQLSAMIDAFNAGNEDVVRTKIEKEYKLTEKQLVEFQNKTNK